MVTGCYPGSFDPPTVAHLAVALAALEQAQLDRLDLVLSRQPLGKDEPDEVELDRRRTRLEQAVADHPRLAVSVRAERLIVDLARGYDVVVMGADKWRQVTDPAWYDDDVDARDAAVSRLPRVLVVPRGQDKPDDVELLVIDEEHRHVSSSAIRAGHPHARDWAL